MYYIELANGVKIPQLGMGGWAQTEENILDALDVGYRLIDTAAQYGNEKAVGAAIRHSGIKREEIFLTTKLWTEDVRKGNTIKAFEESLKRLQLDYVDLYLIHWPALGVERAWRDMEKLYNEGKIRAIGVSNFQISHMEKLHQTADIMPVINQIEAHPYFINREVVDYCKANHIEIEAWCPLGGPQSGIMKESVILKLAEKYEKTAAQIIIRWHLQRGIIIFPKSSQRTHMESNFDVFHFELSQEDIEMITALNRNQRIGADPDTFNF